MQSIKIAVKILARVALISLGLLVLFVVGAALVFTWLDKTNGRVQSGGQERKYFLYVPESYDANVPAALVISIHGYAEWPAHQMEISRWNDLADEHGFLVVYPSGTRFPRRWNLRGEAGTPNDPSRDVTFIKDLVDHLAGQYNLDRARIYANGLSNGGGMSSVLACQLSDRIAAVGSVSGAYLFPPEDCRPTRPVPLIAFHGTADEIVPFAGGPSASFDLPFPVVEDWIAGWAKQNGCQPVPERLPVQGAASGVRYTGCRENAEVVFYTIADGGHSWPGGGVIPEWIVGPTTQDINATELMWAFFSRHTLAP